MVSKMGMENERDECGGSFLGGIVDLRSNMEPVFEEVSIRERITENNPVVPKIRVPPQVSILCDWKVP